jgi:hypothetical protein
MSYEFTFGAHRHTMENPLLCGIFPHGLGAPVGRVTLRDAWRIAINISTVLAVLTPTLKDRQGGTIVGPELMA